MTIYLKDIKDVAVVVAGLVREGVGFDTVIKSDTDIVITLTGGY